MGSEASEQASKEGRGPKAGTWQQRPHTRILGLIHAGLDKTLSRTNQRSSERLKQASLTEKSAVLSKEHATCKPFICF